MIAIVNVGPTSAREAKNLNGERNYEVRINHKVICTFKHRRIDGLAECLYKAADAVRQTPQEKKGGQEIFNPEFRI